MVATILSIFLIVVIVIVSLLSIILVILQSNKSSGIGAGLGGTSQSAFGSRSTDIVTRITGIFTAIFIIGSFIFALIVGLSKERDREIDKTVIESTDNLTIISTDQVVLEWQNLKENNWSYTGDATPNISIIQDQPSLEIVQPRINPGDATQTP